MKQHPRLWVYNYDFEFELANELRVYRDQSGFYPWFFLNRSWHVLLPMAKASDSILAYEEPHAVVAKDLEKKLGDLPHFLVLKPERESNAVFEDLVSQHTSSWHSECRGLSPWGWSQKAISYGKMMGSPEIGKVDVQTINWLNSKKTSCTLRQEILPEPLRIPGKIIEGADLKKEALEKIVTRFMQQHGHVFVKHPYGSAGKLSDVCVTPHFSDRKIRKWKNWIRVAGGIVLEKSVSILQEWSVQVQIDVDGFLHPLALTRLFSTPNGNYLGTLIADADQKRLDSHIDSLRPVLNKIVETGYAGPLGIDLIETTAGEIKLLEINGRLTMGRTAFEWHRRISEMPFSLFTNLIFKTGQFLDFKVTMDRIRNAEQQHGFPVTLLNFVQDVSRNGLLISLLIEGDDPHNIWRLLDNLKSFLLTFQELENIKYLNS
ncbi:MAG: hypothetical protein HOK67_09650 [Deltaproteobacteria bacterium]|nr:hypothetical protein [Deltaproteobacteria bacterium]